MDEDAGDPKSPGSAKQETEPLATDIDRQTINESISRLGDLLKADDAGAVKFYRSVKNELELALGCAMQAFGRSIEQYQFEDALDRLNEIISHEAKSEPYFQNCLPPGGF